MDKLWLCYILLFMLGKSMLLTNGVRIVFHYYKYPGSFLSGQPKLDKGQFISNSTAKCNNIPGELSDLGQGALFINITTDTCLLLYDGLNCEPESAIGISKRMPDSKMQNLYWIFTTLKSFHICNNDNGGNQLNLNITGTTTNYLFRNKTISVASEIFKDVCGCVNFPKRIQKMDTIYINNHGNEIMQYYELDCLEKPQKVYRLRPGVSSFNGGENFIKTFKSFGPVPESLYFKLSCQTSSIILENEFFETENIFAQFDFSRNIPKEVTTLNLTEVPVIRFFSSGNFYGYLSNSTVRTNCSNISELTPETYGINKIGSIQTNTCVMLYMQSNCMGRSIKVKEPGSHNLTKDWHSTLTGPRTLSKLFSTYPNLEFRTRSFRMCGNLEGGPQLNVEIKRHVPAPVYSEKFEVLEIYTNVCSCRNISKYYNLLINNWSIDNHGNSMFAYFEPDCMSTKFSPLWIPPGRTSYSDGFSSFSKTDPETSTVNKIQSFGPDIHSDYFKNNCAKNTFSIMDLELLETINSTNQRADYIQQITHEMHENNAVARFFGYPDFQDFLDSYEGSAECKNLHRSTSNVGSIETNSCIMVYRNYDCDGRSIQILPPSIKNLTREWEGTVTGPRTLGLLYSSNDIWDWTAKSFHLCQRNADASQSLRVDITKYEHTLDKIKDYEDHVSIPETLKSFQNICSCQNIPKNIRDMESWTINNYGKPVIAYFGYNCTSGQFDPLWVPPGRTSYSMGLGSFTQKENATQTLHKVQSIGPDLNSAYFRNNCVKLYANLMKIEIEEPKQAFDGKSEYDEQRMEMTASRTIFQNQSPSQIQQSYSASKELKDSFHVEIGSSLTNMDSLQVDNSFNVETKIAETDSKSISTGSQNVNTKQKTSSTGTHDTSTNSKTKSTGTSIGAQTGIEVRKAGTAILGFAQLGGSVAASASSSVGQTWGSETSSSNSKVSSSASEHSSGVQVGAFAGQERSTSIFQEEAFRKGLRNAYDNSRSNATSNNNVIIEETTKRFDVLQTIIVPACTQLTVHAYVKVVTNKRIKYQALTRIGGKLGNRIMTAAEVRQYMHTDLEYLEDYDEENILAYSNGYINARYGVSSSVSAQGNTLHDCLEENQQSKCPEIPICSNTNNIESKETHVCPVAPACTIPAEFLECLLQKNFTVGNELPTENY